jgi:ABC-2 type transport system ATP-binding protein
MSEDHVVIETRQLTKRYDGFVAVDKLDLTVHSGEVYGLLGPNGAGKTTTILMFLGLTEPTEGSVRILNMDPVRRPLSVKARVGYLPEQMGFYELLTARENLIYIAKLNGMSGSEAQEKVEAALRQVGLGEVADRRVKTFSRGMRQRLGVSDVLVKNPELTIMDEPTQGLDPAAANDLLRIIRQLKDEGITILLCSHLLHQVQAVCDRVALFYEGRKVLEGTVKELAQRVLGGAYRIRLVARGPETLESRLRTLPAVLGVSQSEPGVYELEAEKDIRGAAAEAVLQAGGTLLALEAREPNLDEVYAGYFEEEASHVVAA